MIMELLFLLLSLLLGVILLTSVSLLRYSIYKRKPKQTIANENFPPPPGRTGWPLIGETWEYLSDVRNGALEKFVSERRNKYASEIFCTSLIGHPMAILCGAKGNKFLFSNENKLVQIWFPKSVQKIFPKSHETPINEDFIKVRKLLPAFLKAAALQRFVGTMDAVTKQHMQTYQDCEQVKTRHVVGKYTLAVACRVLLGIDEPAKYEKLANPVKYIAAGILSIPINLPGTAFNRALKASKAICEELEVIIKQRKIDLLEKRASPTEDILSHMLLATDENGQFFNEWT